MEFNGFPVNLECVVALRRIFLHYFEIELTHIEQIGLGAFLKAFDALVKRFQHQRWRSRLCGLRYGPTKETIERDVCSLA